MGRGLHGRGRWWVTAVLARGGPPGFKERGSGADYAGKAGKAEEKLERKAGGDQVRASGEGGRVSTSGHCRRCRHSSAAVQGEQLGVARRSGQGMLAGNAGRGCWGVVWSVSTSCTYLYTYVIYRSRCLLLP